MEENQPGGKDYVGAQHEDVGEEAGSLDRRFASGLPGWFEQFEHSVPGEGEQIEGRQRHREKPLAMAEIVLEFVAVVFQYVEALVLDFPARSAASDDLGDIVFGDGKAGHPGHGIFDLALGVDNFEADPVDQYRVPAVAQRNGLSPAVTEGLFGLSPRDGGARLRR